MISRSILPLLALAAVCTLPTSSAAQEKSDALAAHNAVFRDIYARARKEVLARTGPVVLVDGDNLVLLRNGKRSEARVIPDLYHMLKSVSHSVLAVYLLLVPYGEDEIDAERLERVRGYQKRLEALPASLEGRGLSDALLQRQRKILAEARDFLAGVVDRRKARADEVHAFTRKLEPLVMANGADSAGAQLEGMHRQMRLWKVELTPAEWKSLRVVIMGSAMPRKGNLATQYFARLLGEPGEGLRIIYAEALFDDSRALSLLGTNLLDSGVAVAFFDDSMRMHRDLLADVAREHIKKMHFEP